MHARSTINSVAQTLCIGMVAMTCSAAQTSSNSATPIQTSHSSRPTMQFADNAHVAPDTRIADLLRRPAFAGFGRLLLPWDDRPIDKNLRLQDVDALLPYHSHVDPDTVVSALNRMIDDVNAGHTVFYDIYAKAQLGANPELAQTGVFFFRGKPGAPFAIISPGGGFQYVGSLHEGFPYAAEIARSGYNAFVLKYRVGSGGSKANADLAAALTYIVEHADALGVDRHGYSLWGSSAGARMAAAIGSHGAARFGGGVLPRPAAVVMAYTGHSDVGTSEPPTFVIAGEHDRIAPPSVMRRRLDALRQAGTKVDFHVYPGVGHGFGLGVGTSAEGWVSQAIRFWSQSLGCRKVPNDSAAGVCGDGK